MSIPSLRTENVHNTSNGSSSFSDFNWSPDYVFKRQSQVHRNHFSPSKCNINIITGQPLAAETNNDGLLSTRNHQSLTDNIAKKQRSTIAGSSVRRDGCTGGPLTTILGDRKAPYLNMRNQHANRMRQKAGTQQVFNIISHTPGFHPAVTVAGNTSSDRYSRHGGLEGNGLSAG